MKTWQCWLLAVVVTLGSVVWQRMTGPTHPARVGVELGGEAVKGKLLRSGTTGENLPVRLRAGEGVTGEVAWRRYPTAAAWTVVPMRRDGPDLVAELPHQPAAGKIEYQVRLHDGGRIVTIPERAAVARFKDPVPAWVLIPHVLAMFAGMLLATRAGLEAALGRPRLGPLAWAAFWLILVGGFVLGPAVQKYAFGAWWTGVPFGWDLTDNKTLAAGVAWAGAVAALRGGRWGRTAVLVAALVTLVVFAIPHSAMGSQLDWSKVE
ncbi:MAG TPA: hypothetical protein P5234_02940 [Thermoanaerobaculaceae bacterium]|nr:hypothetical protein [Thermoanaerobaculaceae bacterium]HRS15185.1 hypothetical protein [Thermoanaerobaculaceae bacterium]